MLTLVKRVKRAKSQVEKHGLSREWETKYPTVGVQFPFLSVEIFAIFLVQEWKKPHERLRDEINVLIF